MSKEKNAVIDKISEGWATLLINGGDGKEDQEVVSASALPDNAKEGAWLILGDNGSLSLDPDTTLEKRGRIKAKLDLLRERKHKE